MRLKISIELRFCVIQINRFPIISQYGDEELMPISDDDGAAL